MINKEGLTAVKGFRYAGINAGGETDKRNIGLIYSTAPETVGVGIYTKSDVKAAPVQISIENDRKTHIKKAILINSGNANAFTGKKGYLDAKACVDKAANLLNIEPSEVYVGSTGVIGKKLKIDNILNGIDMLKNELNESEENSLNFIQAIMTTDTRVKQASISFELNGKTLNIASCVKGAGMIMPDMATMLCVILTDAAIEPELMKEALKESAATTFNCITIDGDTSTNDSIFLLSNGLACNDKIVEKNEEYRIFQEKLHELMEHMCKEVVRDGEGVTKFITIDVVNTPTYELAKEIAYSIGNSPLVKTTFYGCQLNWGRLLMAIGKAQTGLDCTNIDIYVNGYLIVSDGEPNLSSEEFEKAQNTLKETDIDICIDFKQGNNKIRIWTSDYSYDYIKINAHYIS